MNHRLARAVIAALTLSLGVAPATAQAPAAKITVRDETQVPRFSYPMTTAPSAFVLADDATFAPFAAAVGADVDRTLRDYDIQDPASKRELLQAKLALQLLAHDDDGARMTLAALRAAETKADLKLLASRLALVSLDANAEAKAHPGTTAAAYDAGLESASLATLPWDVVADTIKQNYSAEQSITRDGTIGAIKHDLDPIAQKTGTLDGPAAHELVELRAQLLITMPLFATDIAALRAYIARHNVVKPDIWAGRDVTLTRAQIKAPVVIGIWDSGVDPKDYPASMYIDAAGRHGLAANDDGTPSANMLYTMPAAVTAGYAKYVALQTGRSDSQAAIDSPEAAAYLAYQKSLSADQAAAFDFALDQIGEYSHGSHVAGIAARGNPGARLAVARFDDNIDNLSFAPTVRWTERMAANFARTAAYFHANHVRVVNMSWSDDVNEFEHWFAKTDSTSDPQTRKKEAQALFALWRSAIENVIASNPATLFVCAAGNGDNDASFNVQVPASLSYPNLITVGAVNQAGDATNFTSYGPTVVVFADGFRVPSKVPGGYTVKYSGTSMASPSVANLAAKLFALDPSLTPVQARALIVNGSTPSPDGKRKLIDPKRSVALLMKHK
ncbi:MAG TPA: S8 family serine peptidase [Candidatus Lustribacter sp.]|nr:S8 family serine peptidase [Candidatus Lustribacter sp.]